MQPSPCAEKSRRRLSTLLHDRKEELIRQWTRRVLDDPSVPEANRLNAPDLRDHIPALIDCLAEDLEVPGAGEGVGRAIGTSRSAREHACHRVSRGYVLTEALRELSHFRAAILDLCFAEGTEFKDDEAKLLHAMIDESMATEGEEMERVAVEKLQTEATFRERFIGILGHDLRNPLQSISFVAAALLKLDDTTEPQARLIRRIAVSADRMARMIADLLEVTRARLGGGIPIEPKVADLRAISQQAIDELEIAHPDRTIRLDVLGDVRGVWDPDRMAQVVSNLVSNALDYSPPDTSVRVLLRGEGVRVLLEVNNQGPTIAPGRMDHLFEPFVQGSQGERVAEGQGLGLGLFIAEQIVEEHGGSLAVASTPEEGTTFTVRLPRSK
jgi:signal transduction histidine kinase